MYRVTSCIYENINGGELKCWMLENDCEPYPYWANKFLHHKALGSVQTCKQYAYKLCTFFNYLDAVRKKHYLHATQKELISFLDYVAFGGSNLIETDGACVSGTTVSMYATVITGLYNFLYRSGVSFELSFHVEKVGVGKYSFFYGQKWDKSNVKFIIENTLSKEKKKQKHIKWYTEEQVNSIIDNCNTYRDKTIFSATCDGMRIDEVLSMKYQDYNSREGVFTCYKSKGRETGNTGRIVILSHRTIKLLENYLYNERAFLEDEMISNNEIPSEYIFLNLKGNEHKGTPVSYRNILEIIKNAARRAGLDPKLIRTHSGRSTKAMELVRKQSENPSSLTDNQLADMMGWADINSASPYKNYRDEEVARKNWERLSYVKSRRDEKFS